MPEALTDLQVLRDQRLWLLESIGWRNFRDFRANRWDPILRRQLTVALDPHLKPYADGVQVLSADPENYFNQIIQILMLRPTKIEAVPEQPGDDAKEDVERDRMYYGHLWRRQNKGRRLDRNRAEGTARYGFAAERMGWDRPGVPEIGEFTEDEADKANRARDKAYMERTDDDPFTIDPVHPLTLSFAPIHDPTLYMEEAVIDITALRAMKNEDGDYLDLDELGKLYARSDKKPLAPWDSGRSSHIGKSAHLITRAQKDPETGVWTVCEWVTLGSGGSASEPNFDEGMKLKEVVVPFGRSPYVIIPSGEYQSLETEPHLAFRPMMYALYVDFVLLNYLRTKIMAYAQRNTNAVVATLEGLRPEYLSMLQEIFGSEGAGAQADMVFKMPNPAVGEMRVMPHVERLPFDLDTALLEMHRAVQEDIKNHAPSRFQTGAASRTEVGDAKAQVYVDASQASALPFEANLGNQDAYGTVPELEAIRAAIIFFDKDTPSKDMETKYPYLVTGNEPLARGGPDAPASGFVNASTMRRKHTIFAQTKNQTQAEAQIESLQAAQDEANGLITHEQHLQRIGVDDIHKQLYLLEQDRQEKDLEPHKRQLITLTNNAIFLGLTGANQAKLLGLPTPQPPDLPGQSPFPGPVEQTPPRSGVGTPQWKPAFMAEAAPTPGREEGGQPGPRMPAPAVSPSPQPFGVGSSPMGPPR